MDFGPEDEVEHEVIESWQNVRGGGGKQERQEANYLLYNIYQLQNATTTTPKMKKEEDERLAQAIAKEISMRRKALVAAEAVGADTTLMRRSHLTGRMRKVHRALSGHRSSSAIVSRR